MNRIASGEKKRMTMTEAAAYLGISAATISRIVKRGELSYSVDEIKTVERGDQKKMPPVILLIS